MLRVVHAVGNHAKTAILSSLLLFKVLEWWFTVGEQELEEASTVIPSPPPTFPRHEHGLAVPEDPQLCPVCLRKRIAPSVLSKSGYVFCYKCIFTHVTANGCCPVTLIVADASSIRRLFSSA
eukprot:TRINITY_DN72029_c0_g1_i1.p1 TRINITY_DN72029_c0_g1~~TRINITY_DN72029_c0_g1_i1.p1  ORF type:complete len:137 (+),score=13.59 TRINITY_DN72029_c0_g1_i1:48-413(+)